MLEDHSGLCDPNSSVELSVLSREVRAPPSGSSSSMRSLLVAVEVTISRPVGAVGVLLWCGASPPPWRVVRRLGQMSRAP